MYRALVALLLLVSAPAWAGGIAGNGGTGIEGNPTGGGNGSGSPAGNTNDLQINAGSGNFGAITPGSGVATALGVNLNGTGALSATTSPTFVTPSWVRRPRRVSTLRAGRPTASPGRRSSTSTPTKPARSPTPN
jgi:hypothetical protein